MVHVTCHCNFQSGDFKFSHLNYLAGRFFINIVNDKTWKPKEKISLTPTDAGGDAEYNWLHTEYRLIEQIRLWLLSPVLTTVDF